MLSEEERAIFDKPFVKQRVGVIETNPFDFDMIDNEVKVANTMCESDHLNPVWAEKLNAMQQIIVPNEYCQKAFLDSGVTQPITIIPHGIDTDRFQYIERPKDRKPFTFLLLGWLDADTDRKGVMDTIQAFASEFESTEDVQLILKSSNPSFGYYKNFTDKRIKTIVEGYTFDDIVKLYSEVDCFVFPSRAEGIGYPPREAMSTGLPTILTNYSGLEDIALPILSYPLQPAVIEPRPNFIEQDGNWARIDVSELMFEMRHVYENQPEATIRGRRASEYLRTLYSWPVVTKKLVSFLETL